MFMLWVFIAWGTLYGASLLYAFAASGSSALRHPVSGSDPIAGVVSLMAAGVAAVAWSALGGAMWIARSQKRADARRSAEGS